MNNDIEKTLLLFQMLGYELQEKEIPISEKLLAYPKYQGVKNMLNIVAYDDRFSEVQKEIYRLEHLSERLLGKTLKWIDELHQKLLSLQCINPFFYDPNHKTFFVNKVNELRVYQPNQSIAIQTILEDESLTNAQRYDRIMQEVECWKASAKTLLQIRKGEYQQLCGQLKERPKIDFFLVILVTIVTVLSGLSIGMFMSMPTLESNLESLLQSFFFMHGTNFIYSILIGGPFVTIVLLLILFTIRPRVFHQLEKRYGRYLQGKMCVCNKMDSFSETVQYALSHHKKLNQRVERYSIVKELQPISNKMIMRIHHGIYQYRPYKVTRWMILLITGISLWMQIMVFLAWFH